MTNNVTPHPRNPMNKAAEFYKRLMVMAQTRKLNQAESELVTAFMLASHMAQAGPITEVQIAAAKRIHRQAVEIIDLGMIFQDEHETPQQPA